MTNTCIDDVYHDEDDPMRLTIIGSRSGIGVKDEASAGYLLTEGDDALLIECGPGVVSRLTRYIALPQLVGVVISHMHWDDYGDLFALANARYYINVRDILTDRNATTTALQRYGPAPVYLPPTGTERITQTIAAIASGLPHMRAILDTPLTFQDYAPNTPIAIGPFTIRAIGPMAHDDMPCFGFRVTCGDAAFGYSGETGMCDALDVVARGVDLFLCDATAITAQVRTEQTRRHLSADEAGQVAARVGARQLVLTHLIEAPPRWYRAMRLAAQANFPGPVHIARPTRQFEICIG